MKKRLTLTTLLIVLVSLLISDFAGGYFLLHRERSAATQSLSEILLLADAMDPSTDPEELVRILRKAAPDKRLTVMDPQGQVLCDTHDSHAQASDYASRPEVAQARSRGWGEDIRPSSTLDVPMLYVARRFADGFIVRISMPLSSINTLVLQITGAFLAASAAALILALHLSRAMARRVLEPLQVVGAALTDVLSGAPSPGLRHAGADEELRPILQYIDTLVDELSTSLQRLTEERSKVNLILDCMDEGLLLLDEHGGVLASNRSARTLFGGSLPPDLHRRLRGAVRECHADKHTVLLDIDDLPQEGRSLRVFLSPVSGRQYEGQSVGTSILISDVTEVKRAERIRADFTANVSHELKTPLTSIKGFSDMLSSGMVASPEDQKRFSSLIGVEADRLITLINDILKLSELESLTMEQSQGEAPVLSTVREAAELLALKAKEGQIRLTVHGEECFAAIPQPRLKEVVLNLAGNGIKYNRPGGSLDLSVEPRDQQVVLTVADTGIGIPPEHQDRVFERFYRVDKGRSRKAGGTGLGLAIVKHIVALYGGSITLESRVDEGSTFTITLPRVPGHPSTE